MPQQKQKELQPEIGNDDDIVIGKLNFPSTAEFVVDYISDLILSGVIRPGEKLPPERLLAGHIGVSRSVLRDALKRLASRELICATQGGGNYVNEIIGTQMADPIAALLRENPQAMDDFMEFRCEFEGSTAFLAAARATSADIKSLSKIVESMEAAQLDDNQNVEAQLDADFHMAVAEISHNVVFIQVTQSLRMLMQQELLNSHFLLFDKSNGENGRKERQIVLDQHRQILNCIAQHDSSQASEAMQNHICYVRDKLRETVTTGQRTKVARQRLNRWNVRLSQHAK